MTDDAVYINLLRSRRRVVDAVGLVLAPDAHVNETHKKCERVEMKCETSVRRAGGETTVRKADG